MKKASSVSVVGVLLLIAAGVFVFYRYYYIPRAAKLSNVIREKTDSFVLKNVVVDPLLIISAQGDGVYDLTARMPMRFNNDSLKKSISDMVAGIDGATVSFEAVNNEKIQSLAATIESPYAVICRLRFVKNSKPKIAIILDDWGYHNRSLPYLSSIKSPYTAAVLPGLRYTKQAADEAYKNKKGIMLHLPMQPEKIMKLEKITVLKDMSRDKIVEIVDSLAGEVPHYTGVNNHQGSLVTADKAAITTVLEVLKERNYFFIDSLTTPKTLAYKTARDMGLRWGKRDVFIDNQKESSYNEKQINELKTVARKKGWAIGIGHDDTVTMETLSRMMPQMEAEGFEFVYAAELLQ